MPHSASSLEMLADWPEGRPVGLLILTTRDTTDWIERVSADPDVARWWAADAENMFVGPSVEAPFDRMLMLEVGEVANASRLLLELQQRDAFEDTSILSAAPIPVLAQRVMGAVSWWLRRLPEPRVPAGALEPSAPAEASEVNPSSQQIERFLKEASDQSLLVLNLNLHKTQAIHPDTGERASGREIADNYFRRGIRTFSRLGARAIWAGGCRGTVMDALDVGAFDQLGLIQYPSREHFAKLLQIGNAEGWDRFRRAGLDRSWVVHCRVTASG